MTPIFIDPSFISKSISKYGTVFHLKSCEWFAAGAVSSLSTWTFLHAKIYCQGPCTLPLPETQRLSEWERAFLLVAPGLQNILPQVGQLAPWLFAFRCIIQSFLFQEAFDQGYNYRSLMSFLLLCRNSYFLLSYLLLFIWYALLISVFVLLAVVLLMCLYFVCLLLLVILKVCHRHKSRTERF